MKLSKYIGLLILVIVITWFVSSIVNVKNARNRENVIYSPDKSKSVEIINAIGTRQVMMNYHKNLMVMGSNVVSGQLIDEKMKLEWNDNQHLTIEIPAKTKLNTKETELQFFSEIVRIEYVETGLTN